MAVESHRGCGYRKVGGVYLVAPPFGYACDRLPILAERCPCCDEGLKQGRGWTWINVAKFVGDDHTWSDGAAECTCAPACPLCHNVKKMGRAGLIWIGAQFYPTIEHFQAEAKSQGISRRIGAIPRNFKLGETWVLLGHPKGTLVEVPAEEGEMFTKQKWVPAIFSVFKPVRIEQLFNESDRGTEAVDKAEKRDITPIFVPDNDPDHHGSAFDKPEKEQL